MTDGALSDAANLRDKVATHDIFPGAQLTAGDFAAAETNVAATLVDRQRAISIPLDSAHGMLNNLQVGSRVDIYGGFNVVKVGADGSPISGGQARPVLKMIMSNILVVGIVKNGNSANVAFRTNDKQSTELAFASDNGKVWVAIRPSAKAKATPPRLVTLESILLDVPSVQVVQSFGGRR